MTSRDDHFEFTGRIWLRSWTGDHYRWTAGNLAVGWNEVVPYDAGHDDDGEVIIKHRRTYYAESDGVRFGRFATTKAAMLEAAREAMKVAA